MKKIFTVASLLAVSFTDAQDTSHHSLTISGYAEAYYAYDHSKPADHNRPAFLYSHNRHNEFNLNLGFIKAAYQNDKVRASIALAAGAYVNANYAAEPGVLKNIYEANAGIAISKKKNLWIDAGIFSSHIGFESAVSKDCPTLTRSIGAENSPYYESGAKLTYTSNNGKWVLAGLLLNGWQRIKKVDGNSLMSVGTQLQYRPSASTTFNWSTFAGTDKPDSIRTMRYFNDLYLLLNPSSKLFLTAGFDIGAEQRSKKSKAFYSWFSPVVIMKYAATDQWAFAARVEHFSDKNGVIIATGTANGFQTTGYSISIDYAPQSNALARLEFRSLNSRDAIFIRDSKPGSNNSVITASLAVSF